ncbi:MarC family protein [Pirellulales bacterium]|nr:MarC family protein [Pirellulales bacterium]
MTMPSTADVRRSIAIKCAIAVAVILVATIWVGEIVLDFFGVEIPSLQVAGGLMIASIALSMLHSKQSAIHDTKNAEDPVHAGRQSAGLDDGRERKTNLI